MVIRTIKTTLREADRISAQDISYIFRGENDRYRAGDVIQFLVMKKEKPVRHSIDKKTFVVTSVLNSANAPITDGYTMIEFRRIA